jgi:hypothetical protein
MPKSTGTEPYVPMPQTWHPAYDESAAFVRDYLAKTSDGYVRVYEPRALEARYEEPGEESIFGSSPPAPVTLTVKKCAGPAPFVGDPRMFKVWYVWKVAVDSLGRHIAGDAEMVWREDFS